MWKQLNWTCGDISIDFSDEHSAKVFIDFNEFNPHLISGLFDKRSAPKLDGVITYSASLSERHIKFTAKVMGFNIGSASKPVETVLDEYTTILCDAFNPRKTGKLTYTTNNGSYFVIARPLSLPIFGEIFGSTLQFTVDLYSDTSFWLKSDENSVNIGSSVPLLGTPLETPLEGGEIISILETITNQTRHDIYPIVRFWPSNSTPMLVNSATGKVLALNTRMSDGFYVEIDTSPEKGTVTLWRYNADLEEYEEIENVSYWLTVDSSTEFEIVPGENVLTAINVVAGNYPAATVIYHERALGV